MRIHNTYDRKEGWDNFLFLLVCIDSIKADEQEPFAGFEPTTYSTGQVVLRRKRHLDHSTEI